MVNRLWWPSGLRYVLTAVKCCMVGIRSRFESRSRHVYMVLLTVIMAGAEPLIEEGSLPHRSNVKLEMKDKFGPKTKKYTGVASKTYSSVLSIGN